WPCPSPPARDRPVSHAARADAPTSRSAPPPGRSRRAIPSWNTAGPWPRRAPRSSSGATPADPCAGPMPARPSPPPGRARRAPRRGGCTARERAAHGDRARGQSEPARHGRAAVLRALRLVVDGEVVAGVPAHGGGVHLERIVVLHATVVLGFDAHRCGDEGGI